MRLLKKFSLVYSLQIVAVFILFFYPGCSSVTVQKEIKPGKTGIITEKKPAGGTNMNTIYKAGDSLNLLKNQEPGLIKYSLLTGPIK